MNFLAHIYLSFGNEELMIGNFIADHITGNKFEHYSIEIKKGIYLHRKIDSFTDSHKIVKISKRRLHERYGHYDGIIIDIFYDYFLAKNWSDYSTVSLEDYTREVYAILDRNFSILPEKTKKLLPYIKKYNWLYNYQFLEGIEDVLKGMNRRTKGLSKMDLAINDLISLENNFYSDFQIFFEELTAYCKSEINKL